MTATTSPLNSHLHALVDMGSNGIRFSISNLSESTARLIPTIYQSRSGISIYDAQHDESGNRIAIPADTISAVISSLISFLRTCRSYEVPEENIRIVATEATRTAPNSDEFRQQIQATTSLTVQLLTKEDEGRIGALGIASSFPAPLAGVVLDLGGGSVQVSWASLDVEGNLERSKTAVSMPFGAAAMIGRLDSGMKPGDLSTEIAQSFKTALEQLAVPESLSGNNGKGLTLYLSGGGFRGWGYALMDRHDIQPYPIPIINGFKVNAEQFNPQVVLSKDSNPITDDIFRISERRASQAPAVALLITSLLSVLPKVSEIYFAQGGVREGSLFSVLPAALQCQHPLIAATAQYATTSRDQLAELIDAAIPSSSGSKLPSFLAQAHSRSALTMALASLIIYHGSCPKDIRPSAALRSTTTGILASTHGLAHETRAWLALALLGRWGSSREDLPKCDLEFYDGLSRLISAEQAWWAGYVGRLAGIIGEIYPAGKIAARGGSTWKWSVRWADVGKKGGSGLLITTDALGDENVKKALKQLVKWGKKKKWEDRFVKGYKIVVEGQSEDDSE